ncbi:TonB-dependent receptor plug domain-containing protein [Polaribacter marinivivus]|uniref:TonB-dependent receptor plug domain-containing protein n=1 Tax=Polaribacter marinivivus TaxID=1524260 RepID=A0ABV8RC47_9FLAO
MKKQLLIVSMLTCSFVNTNLFSQEKKEKIESLDEVVITATKFKLKKENTGKVINTITQEQIQKNAGRNVIELLNTVAGIDVRGVNANPTEPRSINIRGGRSRQVLVLIDGVPVTDQSAINQEFDLRMLSLNQIEKIEILKGASSTLYGSGAATAVINIILKKADENKISASFETSICTNNTTNTITNIASEKNQNITVNGNFEKFSFLTSFSLSGASEMSAAKSNTNAVFEEDSFYKRNGLVKLNFKATNNFNVETFFNYDEFDYDFDAGAFSDSDVNQGSNQQLRVGLKPTFNYTKGSLYLLASLNEVKRTLDQFNSFSNTLDFYSFYGRSINLDLVNKYEFTPQFQVIAGVNYQEHSNQTLTPFGTIDREVANFNTIDPYLSALYISDFGLSLNLGGRLNIHNVYGNQFVYDGNLAYSLLKTENTKVKFLTSYSTAFIAPSLYQLYDGFAGNVDLNPETNETFEIGFDVNYKDWLQFDAVYFNRKETDAIIFDNVNFKYANGSSDANGIEFNTRVMPLDFLTVNASYTYIDRDTFEDFNDYIPDHKFVASVDLNVINNAIFNFAYRNVGERTIFDRFGSFGTAGVDVILDSYQVLDFTANYKILDGTVTFFGNVTNLLNEDYDDILGFSTRGRNYSLGLNIKL